MSSSKWIEKSTCWISNTPQGTEQWINERKGRITMSTIRKFLQKSKYKEDSYSLSRKIVGLSPLEKDIPSPEQAAKDQENFARGHRLEPYLRKAHSLKISKPIREVGLAIWKQDPRFAGSLDGLIELENGDIEGAEYKAPRKMYHSLIEHIEAIKKGFKPPPSYVSHILSDHYDQMIGCGVIVGAKRMHYTVGVEPSNLDRSGSFYTEILDVNYEYWEKELYNPAVQMYEWTIAPLMKENKIVLTNPF